MMTPRDIIIHELTHPLPGYSIEAAEWHATTILDGLRDAGFAVVPRGITFAIASALEKTPDDAAYLLEKASHDYAEVAAWRTAWRAAVEAAEKEIGS